MRLFIAVGPYAPPLEHPGVAKDVCEKRLLPEISSGLVDVLCPVCLSGIEDGVNIVTLKCGHIFCKECLFPWLEQSNSCPVCRLEAIEISESERSEEVVVRHYLSSDVVLLFSSSMDFGTLLIRAILDYRQNRPENELRNRSLSGETQVANVSPTRVPSILFPELFSGTPILARSRRRLMLSNQNVLENIRRMDASSRPSTESEDENAPDDL